MFKFLLVVYPSNYSKRSHPETTNCLLYLGNLHESLEQKGGCLSFVYSNICGITPLEYFCDGLYSLRLMHVPEFEVFFNCDF